MMQQFVPLHLHQDQCRLPHRPAKTASFLRSTCPKRTNMAGNSNRPAKTDDSCGTIMKDRRFILQQTLLPELHHYCRLSRP